MLNSDQQYFVAEELEHYRDGWISRREFIRRAAIFGASGAVVGPTTPIWQIGPGSTP